MQLYSLLMAKNLIIIQYLLLRLITRCKKSNLENFKHSPQIFWIRESQHALEANLRTLSFIFPFSL